MKTKLLAAILTLVSLVSFGQSYKTTLTSSDESVVNITVDVPAFNTTEVNTPRGEAYIVSIPKAVNNAAQGELRADFVNWDGLGREYLVLCRKCASKVSSHVKRVVVEDIPEVAAR